MVFWVVFIQILGQDPSTSALGDSLDAGSDLIGSAGPRRSKCHCPWFWFYLPKGLFFLAYEGVTIASNYIILVPRSNPKVKLPVPSQWPVLSDPDLTLSTILDYVGGARNQPEGQWGSWW